MVDTLVEGDRVTGVVIGTHSGLMTISAEMVIDCSGDGDVAYFAGAETLIDPDQPSPMTLALNVTNVDMEAADEFQAAGGLDRTGPGGPRPTIPSSPINGD